MKKTITILLIALAATFTFTSVMAQYPEWNDPNSLPKWMTPEEELRKHEIGEGFEATLAPQGSVRNIAEFERMQGALIRYNNGLSIPMNLVVSLSQETKLITLASNNTQRNNAMNAYQAAGVNMSNVEFIIAGTNSIWTRDYGPLWIVDGEGQISALDFPYNRPRPLDNLVPGHLANHIGAPIYAMNVVHTGGNYMSTGWGTAASTDLVYEENGNNATWVNQQMEDYAGIETYHVTIDPQGEYIKHIDTWAKFVDVDKIVIGEVPSSHPRYWAYEQVAEYFSNQISAYGTPFQVFRVYTPNGQPYTNALILNHRVFVPTVNSTHDAAALATYQAAMPGYEVLGFYYSGWQSTDALHCRVKEVADLNMLSVRHAPLHGLHEYQPEFEIEAEIIAHSGEDIYTDSLFLIYKANSNLIFDTVPLYHFEDHTFVGSIPVSPGDTLITYYLSAADASGRKETWPLVGAPGARSFQINSPSDIVISPDSLVFDTPEQAFENGLTVTISNPNIESILTIEEIIDPANCYFLEYPQVPLTLLPGESIELTMLLSVIVAGMPGDYFVDTLIITSNLQPHIIKVYINPDLISGTDKVVVNEQSFKVWPNPFNHEITFNFLMREPGHVNLGIFDLQGRKIVSLLDEMKTSGPHQVTWNARASGRLPEGVYIARMIAGTEVVTKRIILTK
jgi:agmatine deiminase